MRTEINAEKIMRIEFFSQLKDKSGATDDFLGIDIAFGPMNHSVTASLLRRICENPVRSQLQRLDVSDEGIFTLIEHGHKSIVRPIETEASRQKTRYSSRGIFLLIHRTREQLMREKTREEKNSSANDVVYLHQKVVKDRLRICP